MMVITKILGLCIFFLFFSLSVSALPMNENSDQSCDANGLCTTIVYSYQKYYQENGQWAQIDENFNINNCESGYNYCVDSNLYQFHIKSTYAAPLVTYGNTRVLFSLDFIESLYPLITATGEANKNSITYKDILTGVDLKYT